MFNLSLINSYFLYGLLLAGAPIIIHLVNKKKAVSLKFPTIRFVIESNKRVAKRFKLRQIILLILRTLAVLFLIFLFARPLLRSEEERIDYANLSRGTVVIVDNSSSMLYRGSSESFFRAAISSAQSIIVGQKNIDSAALITTCSDSENTNVALTFKKQELMDGLSKARVCYTKNKIRESFSDAVNILKDVNSAVKEIYFISDMQRNGWGDETVWGEGLKKFLKESGINVYLVDVASKIEIKNAGIQSVAAFKESRGKINVLNIFSKVKNYSKQMIENRLLKCFIDDKEAVKGFVTLKPYEVTEKVFFTPIDESGIINGYVKLKGDSFAPDDIRYFSLKSFRTVRALVVDGDPTTKVYTSETFYLNLGLNPLKDSYSKIESRIVTYDEFKKEELTNYDVIFLCNVETVTKQKLSEIRRFVKVGGGLIFTLGSKVNPQKYNETFGELLPQRLRDVFTKRREGNDKPFEYISIKDYSHPVLEPFEGADSGDLSTAKFYKYFILQPSVKSKSNIIFEFSNGNPGLVEKRYGKGRVLMFTSSADRDYNDLGIYPTYLPLMQQMTLYVANALGKESYSELIVGDTSDFTVDKTINDVTIISPEGNIDYETTKVLKEIARVTYEKTDYPGFYNVYEGKVTEDNVKALQPVVTFAVNVDPEESDFTKVGEKMLKSIFKDNYVYIEKGADMKDLQLRYMRGEEIWEKLLLFAILALLLEAIISTNWRKRQKVKSAKWKEEGYGY